MDRIRFLLAYVLPASVIAGLSLGGVWVLSPLLVAFVAVPIADLVFPRAHGNPAQGPRWVFEATVLSWLPIQLATMAWAFDRMLSGALSGAELVGGVIAVGVMTGGGGITVAHELMHRRTKLHRASAELLMSVVLYAHFCVEHVLGHHRNVATPADPATSRFGEAVYAFIPRTLAGGFMSAWRLEGDRCGRRGIPALSLRNRRLRYGLLQAAIVAAVGVLLGPIGLALFVGQAAVAVFLLEITNYVEHYGLQRDRLPNGRYERVRPAHSWNSDHAASSALLFQLTHHSDHHATASLPYYELRSHDDAPQLPAGYGTMTMVALVPPLWRAVMDHRVPKAVPAAGAPGEPLQAAV